MDLTIDNRNAGDDNRFVTAKIPVQGDPAQGGGPVFNINAKGSQLRIDVRAPEIDGSPRFYYENDFYGSGGGEVPYRLRHLYGQFYNIIVGQTFSVFEDPDVGPDTVDYKGPPSATFARRPLIRYQHAFNDKLAGERRGRAARHRAGQLWPPGRQRREPRARLRLQRALGGQGANLIWQLRKRLSVGGEVLYGAKETKNGADGSAWRFTLGLVYSIFD